MFATGMQDLVVWHLARTTYRTVLQHCNLSTGNKTSPQVAAVRLTQPVALMELAAEAQTFAILTSG